VSQGILGGVPSVDLDFLHGLYEVHNSAGPSFPEVLARDYLDPDVVFVEFAAAPSATTYRGREAVAALFRDRFQAGTMRVEALELTPLDERRALAAFRIHMRGTGSGADVSMPFWNLLTLDGPRITRVEEFSDEAAALAAARRATG
jgi:ketosteroid isomerase-like protein